MAVSDFALATLGEVKKTLKITSTDTARDIFIESLIEDVSNTLEGPDYLGRNIVGRMYTEYYDGDKTGALLVNHRPLNSISTLLDDTDRDWDSPAVDVIARDDYMTYRKEGKIQLYDDEVTFSLPDGGQNVKIEYHAGYSLLTVNLNQNDWIDFTFGTTSTSAQIPRGEYDCFALASQIKEEMNDVAGATYCDVDFDGKTNKFSVNLSTSGAQTLTLDFATGSNSVYSMATLLGWTKSDLSGATTYTPATAADPHIPRDVNRLCIKLVAFEYNQSDYGEGRQGIKRESIGDYSITYEDVIENDHSITRVINRYKNWSGMIG